MVDYRAVCDADEIPVGSGRLVILDGKEIALFNVEGTFRAMEDHCLHAGGPLHQGELRGNIVVCPWHQWQFDLRDGSCNLNPMTRQEIYAVRVRDGVVEILKPAS